MSGKEVNNLIIDGKRFALICDELIGKKIKVNNDKEVFYTGQDVDRGKLKARLVRGDYQTSTIQQIVYAFAAEKSEIWIQAILTVYNGETYYANRAVYISLNDVEILENGGVNSPSCLLFIYKLKNVREVTPSCR